jgi:hypothetical protein
MTVQEHVRRRTGAIVAAVCVMSTVVAAACGSDSSTSPSSLSPTTSTTAVATHFDSCSVVTQDEAASALGQSVTTGALGHAVVEGGLACVFSGSSAPATTTPDGSRPNTVQVTVVKGPDATLWYGKDKSSSRTGAQSIAGYGNQAFYDGHGFLNVLEGGYYLRIAVYPVSGAPSLTAEEELATDILQKL